MRRIEPSSRKEPQFVEAHTQVAFLQGCADTALPDDGLHQARTEGDVELELRLQLQTDPHLMPIENAGVLWPERLSPRVPVATLRIARQKFDSPVQLDFAKRLSYNPWHCIAEHRPLGNQSRARRRMYYELSKLRHEMNAVPHYEPDGSERFD